MLKWEKLSIIWKWETLYNNMFLEIIAGTKYIKETFDDYVNKNLRK